MAFKGLCIIAIPKATPMRYTGAPIPDRIPSASADKNTRASSILWYSGDSTLYAEGLYVLVRTPQHTRIIENNAPMETIVASRLISSKSAGKDVAIKVAMVAFTGV